MYRGVRSVLSCLALAAFVLFASDALIDRAAAQTCTVAGNATVTLTTGACAIAPNTTLTGTPAVHASTSAQVTTNNVNINPFNGGSIGGLADTSGTITFSSGSSINGNWSTAASAQTGGQIIFQTGSAINPAFGGGGTALLANGVNSGISATGLTIRLNSGGNNVAARATGGGTVNLISGNSISYAAGGGGNTGLWATGAGSQILSTGTALSMPGGGGGDTGVRADTSGAVTFNQGSVAVQGNGGGETGLLAQSAGSTITATGVAVTVSGGGGDVGAKALGGGAITLNGGSVSVPGGSGGEIGLQASGGGSTLAASGVTVTVPSSGNGRGVQADNAGSMTLTAGTTITTSGSGAHAAGVTGGGRLVMTDGSLTANGVASNALNVGGGTATLTNVTLTSPNGTSIAAVGGASNVTLNHSTAITNNGQWLNVGGGSTLDLVVDASTVQGTALTAGGSTSNVTLQNGSLWTMTGDSNVTSLTNGSSLIQFTPPVGDPTLLSSYKTLTAVSYIGQGGTLGLNTFLGADGSPSDRLVVSGGTATGNSLLKITNTTGAGALTTGNGILVVDSINGGTTAAGAFALAGPAVAGPYEYTLFRSSIDASNPQAWYLRSTLNCALTPTLPQCQTPTPPTPTPPTPPTPVVPNFRVETSLYAAIPSMALLYGRNLLDTLHERMGEVGDGRGRANPDGASVGWGRVIGANGVQHGDALGVLGGSAGPRYAYTFLGLQAGIDVYRRDGPDGSRDQAGTYFAIGGDRGRVTHFDNRTGDSDFAAYSLGGYWTHFGPAGWYVDTILQGTFYDISSSANRGLPTFNTVGQGTAASIEGGYPFRFAGGYFIEPQAQLVFQNIHINDTNDIAAQIRFADVNSLAGRIGARFGRTWAMDDSPRTITAWIRPNLWNEFQGHPTTSFSSATGFIPFHADLGGLWGEINAGISGEVTSATTLYANASYQSRFDGGGFAYNGKVGLRVNW
jgi:outer membrane autotransporter protein